MSTRNPKDNQIASAFSNTQRQNNLIERHFELLLFKFRMTLHYCVNCFSLLETFLSARSRLVIQLSKHQINLKLTITTTLSWWTLLLLLLMSPQVFCLRRRALWDHPEWKQPNSQVPVFSLHPTHRKPLQQRCIVSHQELLSLRNFSIKK